jgi:type II secretory ATPase GspE/PulE/Tfp pilus assembly ATPase PilB-like protein
MNKKTNINFPENPVTAISAVDDLLYYAVNISASDIHCDPRAHDVIVRIRADGMIIEAGTFQKRLWEEVIARLKILAGARTDIHAVPQDGRWHAVIDDIHYNIRISFMPTYHGENAVLRILKAKANKDITFASLGFCPDHVQAICEALSKPNGLILVTGPTGSGKTTTLHTCLSQKSAEPISIVTLEDPIEYEIGGVSQIHIRHSHGVTFVSGLRSVMRQDPDVIMVGEIRDNETARVCLHTALTGHLLLSTLHTNSALETITRLADMGIDNYLIAATVKLIIAQRLVRTRCRSCDGVGCEDCNQIGLVGRTVITEVLKVDEKIQKMIIEKRPISEMATYLKNVGYRNMYEDGMEKVDWGLTTKAELSRVLSDS